MAGEWERGEERWWSGGRMDLVDDASQRIMETRAHRNGDQDQHSRHSRLEEGVRRASLIAKTRIPLLRFGNDLGIGGFSQEGRNGRDCSTVGSQFMSAPVCLHEGWG